MKRKISERVLNSKYVEIDPQLCGNCSGCKRACPKGVFGKIGGFFSRKTSMINPDACIGCAKCVKACRRHAIKMIPGSK